MPEISSEVNIRKVLPLENLQDSVRNMLHEQAHDSGKVGLACSGGLDSVFLLRWFLEVCESLRSKLIVLHFNHGVRGYASDEDEAFVHELAQELGVESISGKRDQGGVGASEADLRKDRQTFFRKVAEEHSLRFVLVGHHRDDRVETLLMRLSRGSGLDGIVAPHPVSRNEFGLTMVRPLWNLSKSIMRDTLTGLKQEWREDVSNQNCEYYRNVVRNRILPFWREYSPLPLDSSIAASCNQLFEDAEALNTWAASALADNPCSSPLLQRKLLSKLPRAVQRRVLHIWLNHHQVARQRPQATLDQILDSQPENTLMLGPSRMLHVHSKGDLELKATPDKPRWKHLRFLLHPGGVLYLPGARRLGLELLDATPELINTIRQGECDVRSEAYLDARSSNGNCVIIGFRRKGLKFQPLGMRNSRKLQDCLVDKKIPADLRDRLPLAFGMDTSLLWAPGLPPGHKVRVRKDSKSVLRLTYLPS